MEELENATSIVIFSGEGEAGSFKKYSGVKTMRGIRSRLTKERCGGDRFAKIYVVPRNDNIGVELNDDGSWGEARLIPASYILV